MFNWLKKDKSKSEHQVAKIIPKTKDQRPRINISYNPELIKRLVSEHQYLLGIYTAIISASESRDYELLKEKLNDFGINLKAHLLTEHIELYIYLEYILSSDQKTFRYMHELRMEMDEISSEVIGFLHTYRSNPVNDQNVEKFQKQFEKIGHILSERIQREEKTLYTLYTSVT